MTSGPLLSIHDYHQHFRLGINTVIRAVNGISFDIRAGEIFGLVGESGCGKSTVARAIMGMHTPTRGEIYFKNQLISDKKSRQKHKKDIQRNMQIIFQDSAAALNPRMSVEEIIAEPLVVCRLCEGKREREERIAGLLELVGLEARLAKKMPGELSGGQRQRVSIARSLAARPEFIVADEPIASLDVSIQAQIVALFQQLREEKNFSLLFIAHDLSMVRYLCDRVGVMYAGKLVELAPAKMLFDNPVHPYTRALLSSIPLPDPILERRKPLFSPPSLVISPEDGMTETEAGHFVLVHGIKE